MTGFKNIFISVSSVYRQWLVGASFSALVAILIGIWYFVSFSPEWFAGSLPKVTNKSDERRPLVYGIRMGMIKSNAQDDISLIYRSFGNAHLRSLWANDHIGLSIVGNKFNIKRNDDGEWIAEKDGNIFKLSFNEGVDLSAEDVRPIESLADLRQAILSNPKRIKDTRARILRLIDNERAREAENPGLFGHGIAVLLTDLAKIHLVEGDTKGAETFINNAITVDRELVAKFPDEPQHSLSLARTLQEVAVMQDPYHHLVSVELQPSQLLHQAANVVAPLTRRDSRFMHDWLNYLSLEVREMLRQGDIQPAVNAANSISDEVVKKPNAVDSEFVINHLLILKDIQSALGQSGEIEQIKMKDKILETSITVLNSYMPNVDLKHADALFTTIHAITKTLIESGKTDNAHVVLSLSESLYTRLKETTSWDGNPSELDRLKDKKDRIASLFEHDQHEVDDISALKNKVQKALDKTDNGQSVQSLDDLPYSLSRLHDKLAQSGKITEANGVLKKTINSIDTLYKKDQDKYGIPLFTILAKLCNYDSYLYMVEKVNYALQAANIWTNIVPQINNVDSLKTQIGNVISVSEMLTKASHFSEAISMQRATLTTALEMYHKELNADKDSQSENSQIKTSPLQFIIFRIAEEWSTIELAGGKISSPSEAFRIIIDATKREKKDDVSRQLRIMYQLRIAKYYTKRFPKISDSAYEIALLLALEQMEQKHPSDATSMDKPEFLTIAKNWYYLREHNDLGATVKPYDLILEKITQHHTVNGSGALSINIQALVHVANAYSMQDPKKADQIYNQAYNLILQLMTEKQPNENQSTTDKGEDEDSAVTNSKSDEDELGVTTSLKPELNLIKEVLLSWSSHRQKHPILGSSDDEPNAKFLSNFDAGADSNQKILYYHAKVITGLEELLDNETNTSILNNYHRKAVEFANRIVNGNDNMKASLFSATTVQKASIFYFINGNYNEARKLEARTLDIWQDSYKRSISTIHNENSSPDETETKISLGYAHALLKLANKQFVKFSDKQKHYLQAIDVLRKINYRWKKRRWGDLGRDVQKELVSTLYDYNSLLLSNGQIEQGLPIIDEARIILEHVYPKPKGIFRQVLIRSFVLHWQLDSAESAATSAQEVLVSLLQNNDDKESNDYRMLEYANRSLMRGDFTYAREIILMMMNIDENDESLKLLRQTSRLSNNTRSRLRNSE